MCVVTQPQTWSCNMSYFSSDLSSTKQCFYLMVKWKYNPPHRDWNYSCHFSSDDKGNQSIYWCFSQLTTVIIQMTGWSDGSSAGMKIFISISFNYSTLQSGEGEHSLQSLLARRGSSDRKPESVLSAFSLSLSVLTTSTSSTTTRQHFYASWTLPPPSPPPHLSFQSDSSPVWVEKHSII